MKKLLLLELLISSHFIICVIAFFLYLQTEIAKRLNAICDCLLVGGSKASVFTFTPSLG